MTGSKALIASTITTLPLTSQVGPSCTRYALLSFFQLSCKDCIWVCIQYALCLKKEPLVMSQTHPLVIMD